MTTMMTTMSNQLCVETLNIPWILQNGVYYGSVVLDTDGPSLGGLGFLKCVLLGNDSEHSLFAGLLHFSGNEDLI